MSLSKVLGACVLEWLLFRYPKEEGYEDRDIGWGLEVRSH